ELLPTIRPPIELVDIVELDVPCASSTFGFVLERSHTFALARDDPCLLRRRDEDATQLRARGIQRLVPITGGRRDLFVPLHALGCARPVDARLERGERPGQPGDLRRGLVTLRRIPGRMLF